MNISFSKQNYFNSILKFIFFGAFLFSLFSCSTKQEELGNTVKGSVSFHYDFNSVTNKQSMEMPSCSSSKPAYAMIVISGPENIGTMESPKKVMMISSDGENYVTAQTNELRIPEGDYQLDYFAVYNETDEMIWLAPQQTNYSQFVKEPLPLDFSIMAYEATTATVPVICLEDRTLIDPNAITAKEYVGQLGKGFDVTWAEFNKYMELYKEQVSQDFSEAGFKNVRIRMNDEDLDATFMAQLKKKVDDALKYGLDPVIAYQGHYLEETATSDEEARQHLVEWWRKMAQEFQNYPPELAFNIMVEISGKYKDNYKAINSFYADVYDAIRETNPSRILIFPPVNISNPEYLQHLEIPGTNDPYTMAEWHFYAAGPKKDPGSKKYWLDGSTAEERQNIMDPINTAVQWMHNTGNVSWVGAWMPGNYNKGNDYTVEEQVGVASFITRQLNAREIPFSVNAGNKFYDYNNLSWLDRTTDVAGKPVRDAILDSEKAAVYNGQDYAGASVRLSEGQYMASDLQALGVYENIQSVMVPFDYEVIVYSGDDFSGDSKTLDITTRNLNSFAVHSVKVIYKNS